MNVRKLYLQSCQKGYNDKQLADLLGITVNDLLIYQYGYKALPEELEEKWLGLLS